MKIFAENKNFNNAANGEKINIPAVSVVIPVYESAKFLADALDSIVNQTFKDIEIICIYDESQDNTLEILESYAQKDNRFVIIKNPERKNIAYALNIGIKNAKGKYIARMDSDDISVRTRLEEQFRYMESHQDMGICGSYIKKFGKVNRLVKSSVSNEDIKANLLFNCCVFHPTAFIRKSVLEKYNLLYDENYAVCEDYDMWARCIKYCKFSNIPKALLNYREHDENISKEKDVHFYALGIIKKQCSDYFVKDIDENVFKNIFDSDCLEIQDLKECFDWILQNIDSTKVDKNIFKKYLTKAVIKKLRSSFKKNRNFYPILCMFKYNFIYAIFFLFLNVFKIKRWK